MDSSDNEYDMLDLLAWNCSQLTTQLSEANSSDARTKLLQEYIKRVDGQFESIGEFKEELDWFNISKPLTLNGDLKGKIVVLDFFTYCCINCMHIMPDLKKLEQRYSIEDGLVVVGVHSAKFDNEKESTNILAAIQRYDITHPVMNDSQSSLWMDLHIKCWPTLVVLGPRANPLFVLMGEGHANTLDKYVGAAIRFYRESGTLKSHTIELSLAGEQVISSNLKFPGKIASSQPEHPLDDTDVAIDSKICELYAVSDTGNHRILLFTSNGTIIEKIGGKESGFADGSFAEARFNSPQGVTFYGDDTIYVADTENHAIREINLKTKTVDTIAGHGKQGVDQTGGLIGTSQEISSPWDLVTYRTRDMDMSFHMDEEVIPERDIILLAMAGTHQIWAIFKDETIWWKFKKFPEGAVAAIAGNGHEENRNNSYPQNAAFAQPSGLALSAKRKEVYIADSESSSIRKLSLADGKVMAVAGGDRNPLNLFAFGDVDGIQMNAKLQHPLGVAYKSSNHCLYVADTYNHKIKMIDLATNKVSTCAFKTTSGNVMQFNEPGGLCISPCGNYLYVCNTNNHSVELVNLNTSTVESLKLKFNAQQMQSKRASESYQLPSPLSIQLSGAKIHLEFRISTQTGVKFTVGAPQKWQLIAPNEQWQVITASGVCASDLIGMENENNNDDNLTSSEVTILGENIDQLPKNEGNHVFSIDVTAPSASAALEEHDNELLVTFKLSLCAAAKEICFPKQFTLSVPVVYSSNEGVDCIDEKINVTVGDKDVNFV